MEITEVDVKDIHDAWMEDAGSNFWKPEPNRDYSVVFEATPEKERNPFKDGEERWVISCVVDGMPMHYAPGRRFLGALKAAYEKAGKVWGFAAIVRKTGEGMKTTWSIAVV